MNKSLFILTLCFFTFIGCGQKKSDNLGVDTSIQLIDSVWSFGHIKSSSSIVSDTIQLKNTGNNPLMLRDLKTTCGCVEVKDYTRTPIPPHCLGYIFITFDPKKSARGFVNKKVEIHSNAINFVEATVTGYVD
jgi:hypothetical protein